MSFPTYDAFGGFVNSIVPFGRRRRVLPTGRTLDSLNTGVTRIVDVYAANYAEVVRDNPAPFAVLDSTQKGTRVAIIGAGMSGLCALYELTRCGLTPTLFEASGRIGGRCFTEHFETESPTSPGEADPAEMGAMRFPDTAKLMWHYFKKTVVNDNPDSPAAQNPTFQPFPNPGIVATALNVEGNTSTWISNPNDLNFGLPQRVSDLGDDFDRVFVEETTIMVDPKGHLTWTLEHAAGVLKQPTLSAVDEKRLQAYWSGIINKFDKMSLETFVRTQLQTPPTPHNPDAPNWTESDVRMFKAVGFGTGGMGQDFPTSMVDFIRYDLWNYEALYRWGPEFTSSGFAESFLKLSTDLNPAIEVIMSAAFNIRIGRGASRNIVSLNYIEPGGTDLKEGLFDYIIMATGNPAMMQPMLLDEGTNAPPIVGQIERPYASLGDNLSDPLTLYTKQIRESIRNVEFYPSTKIWAATDETLLSGSNWPTADNQKVRWIVTDRLLGQTAIFPNADIPPSKYSVLLTYQNGFDSLRYHPLPLPIPTPNPGNVDDAQYALATNQLTLSYIGMSSNNPDATVANDVGNIINASFFSAGIGGGNTFKIEWHNEPYIQGAFRLLLAGQYNYNAALAFQYTVVNPKRYIPGTPDGIPQEYRRVFLAGESAFFLDGWIEGPLYAGVNSASAVLYAILGAAAETGLRTAQFVDPDFIWRFGTNAQTAAVDFWNDSMT
ncbi:flavin monoamine oxidase family protein [Pseudomonas sp. AP3_22 TE3818]